MNIEVHRAKRQEGRWWIVSIAGFEAHRALYAKDARRFARNLRRLMARMGNKALDAAAFLVASSLKSQEFDDPYENDLYSYCESEPLEAV